MKDKLIKIIKEASKQMMTPDVTITQKGTHSDFVTSADLAVQHYLEKHLLELLPGSTFLGEEEGKQTTEGEYIWVVDPIDGTSNFVRDLGVSGISVGLIKNGTPYIGAIYTPYRDEMYYAERGKGAFLNGKQIFVSQNDFRHSHLCTAASVYNKALAPACFRIIQEIYYESDDFRRFGSAAVEMAYLAAGRVELYFEIRLFPWDMAAAQVLIEEAGGFVEFIHEDKLPLNRPAGIIAANSKESLERLKEIVYSEIPNKLNYDFFHS